VVLYFDLVASEFCPAAAHAFLSNLGIFRRVLRVSFPVASGNPLVSDMLTASSYVPTFANLLSEVYPFGHE